jgi:signal transduction histidine kinase
MNANVHAPRGHVGQDGRMLGSQGGVMNGLRRLAQWPQRRQWSLRTELLATLGFVTSAAIILVGLTTALVAGGDLSAAIRPLVALWFGSTVVFVLYGVHVVHRMVIRPLHHLSDEADALAAGGQGGSEQTYETAELAHLSARFRMMADELLSVQSQIVRVEKLAGIGSLAAGVAHEVRNPLGALSAYVDLLRIRGTDPAVTDSMRGAIERIELTVRSLLAYARPGVAGGSTDLNQSVQTSLEFLKAQGLLRTQRVTVQLESGLPPVSADRHLLEQVVVNLVMNACQASPGGVLVVGTAHDTFAPRDGAFPRAVDSWRSNGNGSRPLRQPQRARRPRDPDVPAGTPGALLYVADDGPGVPDEARERVFDPFYTTKDPGEGTGLGLAIVARTVHEAGGMVWVDRAREGGANFKVFLPFAVQSVSSASESSHAPAHR